MSSIGRVAGLMGRLAYQFSLYQPALLTFSGLLLAALFPIYCGSHASLSRPSSAAKPDEKDRKSSKEEDPYAEDEEESGAEDESSSRMSGLHPEDALWFPLIGGLWLGGLYLLIKWLDNPALLNRLLNVYFSFLGLVSVGRFLGDSFSIVTSFVFPQRWSDGLVTWHVTRGAHEFVVESSDVRHLKEGQLSRESPFPGWTSKISLGRFQDWAWMVRELLTDKFTFRILIWGRTYLRSTINLNDILGFFGACLAVIGYNFIGQPWWLVDVLGFGLSYGALQIISPRTFWTGTMVLSSLFLYDGYFVFFTPLMVTVAKSLNVPIKLLIPRPRGLHEDPSSQPLAMLGLGDVVLPGIMIALALRFDLYLWYLHKQKQEQSQKANVSEGEDDQPSEPSLEIIKAQYRSATGRWGERFWTQSAKSSGRVEPGAFPKPYFHASLIGYILGLITTFAVLAYSGHAQPALLYLVPGVLISLWGLAAIKGDSKEMWEYLDVTDEEPDVVAEKTPMTRLSRMSSLSKRATKSDPAAEESKETRNQDQSTTMTDSSTNANADVPPPPREELLSITLTKRALPSSPSSLSSSSQPLRQGRSGADGKSSIVQEIRDALDGDLHLRSSSVSPPNSSHSTQSPPNATNTTTISQRPTTSNSSSEQPPGSHMEKRPRLE